MNYFDPHTIIVHSRINVFFSKYYYLLLFLLNKYVLRKKVVVIDPWISMSWTRVEHNNWGDDINIFMLRRVTNNYLMPFQAYAYPQGNIVFRGISSYTVVSAIGSVLHLIKKQNTIVWGSGLINENLLPPVQPYKILAVRGPLTRKVLLSQGYDCPEVYGDPALLLPYVYTPKKKRKRYILGIVPHYVDYYKEEVKNFIKDEDVLIINMFNYKKWTDVVDQINSCEIVASSSLHGLIVAEAYKVPNIWVEIREPLIGDISRRFKYHDFFLSIGLDRDVPYTIDINTTKEDLLKQSRMYKRAPGLSLKELVNVCPFDIKESIKNAINI